jgi:glycosyltransferase involved in cell wall biosynthesis
MIRLGFHYHNVVSQSEQGLYTIGHMARFLESLAKYCESVVLYLHGPSTKENAILDQKIESKNVRWVNIGPHLSTVCRQLRAKNYTKEFYQYSDQIDALLIRGPSPLLPAFSKAGGTLPQAFLLGGDYREGIDDIKQSSIRRYLLHLWAHMYYSAQVKAITNQLVFVNSPKLMSEARKHTETVYQVKTTTLYENDFFHRDDTCISTPYRLLYTGRMSMSKGLFEMVQAVSKLAAMGEDVILDLVGPVQNSEPLCHLFNLARDLGVQKRIVYHGYKTVGPELFAYYKQADIYLIMSRSTEGFPRTVWEAMAHSLPVIATNVGGIPTTVEGSALVINPCSVDELAIAIQLLIHNQELRQQYIRAGYLLAQENTLEKQAMGIIQKIEDRANRI